MRLEHPASGVLLPGEFLVALVAYDLINPTFKQLLEQGLCLLGILRHQGLHLERAASVASALTKMGVDRSRILTQGYGEEYAVGNNGSVAGRQQNRRVEVIVSTGSAMVDLRH